MLPRISSTILHYLDICTFRCTCTAAKMVGNNDASPVFGPNLVWKFEDHEIIVVGWQALQITLEISSPTFAQVVEQHPIMPVNFHIG